MKQRSPHSNAVAVIREHAGVPARIEESKAQRFKRLANGRALDAIAAIERLGNLATPAYEYSQDDINRLRKAIIGALADACGRLETRTAATRKRADIL